MLKIVRANRFKWTIQRMVSYHKPEQTKRIPQIIYTIVIAISTILFVSTHSSAEPVSNKSYEKRSQAKSSIDWGMRQNTDPVPKKNSQETAAKGGVTAPDLSTTDLKTELLFDLGYRIDALKWNIAGDINGSNPNVLSELTWENLAIIQIEFTNTTIFRDIYFRGSLGYGWIFSGDNQDSDFLENNRTQEYSRSNNNADDGNTFDASLGVGHQFTFWSDFMSITPLIGYSRHNQNLTIKDGNQTISFPEGTPLGPFSDLDSTYETEWKGPWVGFDAKFSAADKIRFLDDFELVLSVEYHWGKYAAEGNWNLRTDLAHPKSFDHDTKANGLVLSADWNIFFGRHWTLNLDLHYQTWSTDPGIDRTFFADGTIAETRLNDVDWESYAFMLGLAYRF